MLDRIEAPWTPEQVQALNRYQQGGWMHPFTCPAPVHKREVLLVATAEGFVCPQFPDCPYQQDWAWEFMAALSPDRGCPTPDCSGDARYAAPGRGHRRGCTYPLPEEDE